METRKQESDPYQTHVQAATELQAEAWSAFNSAFHAPDADEYRQAGRDLYKRVIEEKILALFSRGDEQNQILDSLRA